MVYPSETAVKVNPEYATDSMCLSCFLVFLPSRKPFAMLGTSASAILSFATKAYLFPFVIAVA